MDIEVATKDCSSLSDYEIEEMANLSALGDDWGIGRLSKEKDVWVLCSQVSLDGDLQGFALTSLERIGGTPSLVVGVACMKNSAALDAVMQAQFFKTSMAFPDEDVLVAIRTNSTAPLYSLANLNDPHPHRSHAPNGEQRAWGRRLAKRLGAASFDDRLMVAKSKGDELFFQLLSDEDVSLSDEFELSNQSDDYSIAWGWLLAEDLAMLAQGKSHALSTS